MYAVTILRIIYFRSAYCCYCTIDRFNCESSEIVWISQGYKQLISVFKLFRSTHFCVLYRCVVEAIRESKKSVHCEVS